ncbi:hypothetical protein H2204_006588 [Knufia peltigerae]|uniref:FAD-binding domain-containing protein n=1 Tax=Knufia peltigerae TaxID=1002370 RepID=A0AA38Y3N6_9EURO|nr:hypothetical protein H2204_006588 [Knufia peltigerae]
MLAKKGYKVMIVERVAKIEDVGGALAIWPNGWKVLDTIGQAKIDNPWRHGVEYNSKGEQLVDWDQSYFKKKYGFPSSALRRSELHSRLKQNASDHGVEVLEGWKLSDIQEVDSGVVAVSEDGREVQAKFVIGCDGLHSATRKWVLAKKGISEPQPDFTGLVTIVGFSPTPASIESSTVLGVYGDEKYFVTYKVDEKSWLWGIIEPGEPERESWRDIDDLEAQKEKLLSEMVDWPEITKGLVGSTMNLVRFGLYDRPELPPEHWYHGRCVLVGDAAHPTRYGFLRPRGANQSLEDCWHLAQLLPDADSQCDISELKDAFQKYAEKRQPRTAELVKAARQGGKIRVVHGEEACRKRDGMVKRMYADEEAMAVRVHNLYKEPFEMS